MDYNLVVGLLGIAGSIIAASWFQGIWISRQFSVIKDFINDKVDDVLNKLQYHERHDDKRFDDITNRIWMMKLENATSKTYKNRDVRREDGTA